MGRTRHQVVILICCYNARQHLPQLLGSLTDNHEPRLDQRIVAVDNASTDGTRDYIRAAFPSVDCLRVETNLGFAGGNNAGYDYIRRAYPEARYLVLLNPDTIVPANWLSPLVHALEANPALAAVQPTILLHPETHHINTTGGLSHYLGFGMMRDFYQPATVAPEAPRRVNFASGAAMMLRLDVVSSLGLFDDRFYLYLEDADLGWALRQRGYAIEHEPASRIYHKYQPTAPTRHYRHLERNRWLLLLIYYHAGTLAWLAPALALMELGQLAYACQRRLLPAKLASYRELLAPAMRRHVRRRRWAAQHRRVVSDRAMLAHYTARVTVPGGDPWPLRYLANPIFQAYWAVIRGLWRLTGRPLCHKTGDS